MNYVFLPWHHLTEAVFCWSVQY